MRYRPVGLLGALTALACFSPCSARVWYVKAGASGDGSSWAAPLGAIPAALSGAASGDEIWVAAGTYAGNITLKAGTGLYGGFAGTETARAQRVVGARTSILDATATKGSVVTAPEGCGLDTVLDGFAITGGGGTNRNPSGDPDRYGGGILIVNASPTIANNTVKGNTAKGDLLDCDYAHRFYCPRGDGSGGGIYCKNSNAAISGNEISGNSAWSEGGGIYCDGGAPTISGNVISANDAADHMNTYIQPTGGTDGRGAGVSLDSTNAVLSNNTISGNRARISGGGIHVSGGAPTISGNAITANSTSYGNDLLGPISDNGQGGGMWMSAGTATGNQISGNSAEGSGGGAYITGTASLERNRIRLNHAPKGGGVCGNGGASVRSNTFEWNRATKDGGGLAEVSTVINNAFYRNAAPKGGAMSILGGAIVNNIIAFNAGGIYRDPASSAILDLKNNCAYANTMLQGTPTYTTSDYVNATASASDGNIVADPLVADLAFGNNHIQPGSPCRSTGSSAYVPAGSVDVDGQPRIQESAVDIGPDESDGTSWTTGAPKIVRVAPAGDDANDGSSWPLAKKTFQAAVDALPAGGEVWAAGGTYMVYDRFGAPDRERVHMRPYVYIYGGFAGTETSRTQRNPTANPATVGSNMSVWAMEGVGDCGLDGVTLSYAYYLVGNVAYDYWGQFITVNAGQMGVTNCKVAGSEGIRCDYGFLSIDSSTVSGNYDCALSFNGSIFQVNRCAVVDNQATGIKCSAASGVITSNVIARNRAGSYWSGGISTSGGNYFTPPAIAIANNLIQSNSGNQPGIYIYESAADIINNTIVGNVAATAGPDYGSVVVGNALDMGPVRLVNNVIAFNTAGITNKTNSVQIRKNAVFGNADGNYSGKDYPSFTADGNIVLDPAFRNRSGGDYRLAAGSPCLDAGDDSVLSGSALPAVDLDRRRRLSGAHIDMGCYEAGPGDVASIANAARALRIWAGLDGTAAADLPLLNVETGGASATCIDIADATRLLRLAFQDAL